MDGFVIDTLLEDDIDFNVINVAVNNLAEPVNIIPKRNIPTYNEGYVNNTIPNYSLTEFKHHFRLSRAEVVEMCNLLAPMIDVPHVTISLETKFLFFVWTIAKQESFLAVSDRFGFSKGTGHYVFCKVLHAICRLKDRFIKLPNARECREMETQVEQFCRFPGVVGFIDGCHVAIKQPVHNPIDFYNRKGYHSTILQGVCNNKAIFTDIWVGVPGKLHDARVFRTSSLYRKLTANPPLFAAKQHLLGDSAYPLMQNLLRPYRDNGHLSAQQIKFNQVLAAQRQVIERAFGLLKGRWRRLKYLDMSLENEMYQVITAACILHNFLSFNNNDFESPLDNDNNEFNYVRDEDVGQEEIQNNAVLKREYISTLL